MLVKKGDLALGQDSRSCQLAVAWPGLAWAPGFFSRSRETLASPQEVPGGVRECPQNLTRAPGPSFMLGDFTAFAPSSTIREKYEARAAAVTAASKRTY
ncbi:hypothetical protein PoB_003752800 [Plakobranchus ocellatus]|uniref:Uncharacterized protein n=1 Tax=Plakobranchus ocellatus TaxID=259542 RepID=A0AAV4AWX4_9GAST|nr:hypothetical protein PoB_003752800 [Plakobranchus ocellatus]